VNSAKEILQKLEGVEGKGVIILFKEMVPHRQNRTNNGEKRST